VLVGGAGRGGAQRRGLEVRRGADSRGAWESALSVPDRALRGAIVRYRGYRVATGQPNSRLEIPVGLPAVVFTIGAPITLEDATGAGPPPQPMGSFVVGLRTRCLRGSHLGHVEGVEVMLTPAGAYAALGCAMHEVANGVFPVAAVFGRPGRIVEERMAEAAGWSERFALLDEFFAERAGKGLEPSVNVHRAWSWLERDRPRATAARLADDLGWSQRRLELAFREQVGLAPVTIVRMARFRRAVRLLVRGGSSLTDLAAHCGYYDQSHFNREFRAVTGTSPQRYLDKALNPGPGGDVGLPARLGVRSV
jgi:AraC-like DNA-binding protein